MLLASQSTHRQGLLDILAEHIRHKATEETMPFATAATRVLLVWLGYDLDDVTFIEGSDRGIDAWVEMETGLDLFQIKTHDPDADGLLDLRPFDGQGVRDLERAKIFLLQEQPANVANKQLKQLLHQWSTVLRSHRLNDSALPLPVTLHLIVLGDGLTEPAMAEFKAFQAANTQPVATEGDVAVRFHATLRGTDQVVEGRWREENREWKDRRGHRRDSIQLTPWVESSISDDRHAVFYCRAIDLVNAYEALGYQLFEPNVRANIKASRVNQAIRDSVLHQRTRREFRFLNNGVTVTCDTFTKPTRQRPAFMVMRPGVVNGLQTVVALHTAYQQLTPADKGDFEKHCAVLIRLLLNNAVDDISRVVKATNNQNPMRLRNLVSNNPEQLLYARIFATELSWFYEAKEGAWDAFEKDPRRWRPSLGKLPRDFRPPNRRKARRADNEELAQTWLAFIGFAAESLNEKKYLFEERFYPLIFLRQTRLHGADYDFVLARAREEASEQSPDASMMLISYLAHDFAAEMSLSPAQNRQRACERLNIDPVRLTRAELDARLSQDNEFILNQALAGMSMLFAEFVGFVFYRAFGDQVHRFGRRILSNGSLRALATDYDIDQVKILVEARTFAPRDLLPILWLVFVETIEDMVNSGWGQSYRAASVKVRFVFSRETRTSLYRNVQGLDEFMQKRSMKKAWAIGVEEGQGLFAFVHGTIAKQ